MFRRLGLLLLVEFRIRHQVLSTLGFVSWFAVCCFSTHVFLPLKLESRCSIGGLGHAPLDAGFSV